MKSRVRFGFSLVELLIVTAIIGVLIGLLLPAIQKVRESAKLASCENNLKQIGIAMRMHEDSLNRLPRGAETTWVQDLLPYLEADGAEPTVSLETLLCPSRRNGPAEGKSDFASAWHPGTSNGTSFNAIPGPHTSGWNGKAWKFPAGANVVFNKRNSVLGGHQQKAVSSKFVSTRDGTANTALLAHRGVKVGSVDGEAIWTDPNYYSWHRYPFGFFLTQNNLESGCDLHSPVQPNGHLLMTTEHRGGMPVLFVDGSVRTAGFKICHEVVGFLWAFNDNQVLDDALLGVNEPHPQMPAAPPAIAPLTLVNNNLLVVAPSQQKVINSGLLQATSGYAGPSGIRYTLTSAPTRGVLRKGAGVLNVGSLFTQAEIDSGLLNYTAFSTITGDSFNFSVTDTKTSLTGKFNISITLSFPTGDPPAPPTGI